jgi:hypothetical protein
LAHSDSAIEVLRYEARVSGGVVSLFSPCRAEFDLDLGQAGPRGLNLLLTLLAG